MSMRIQLDLCVLLTLCLRSGFSQVAECKPINSSLPPECPGTIGPPCPRCYTNTMPDYAPSASPFMSEKVNASIARHLDEYMQLVNNHSPSDATVFTGSAGRALIYLKMYFRSQNETALNQAVEDIQYSLHHIDTLIAKDKAAGYTGFMWSHYGVYALAAVIGKASSKISNHHQYAQAIKTEIEKQQGKWDDFDGGYAGLLYCGSFLNEHYQQNFIPDTDLTELALKIIQDGIRPHQPYLAWQSPNDKGYWLGTSHGSAGVVYTILTCAPQVLSNQTAGNLIWNTVDHIVMSQFPTGNFPSEYYNDTADVLVQWDHGAPGVSHMLFIAHQTLQSMMQLYPDRNPDSYLTAANLAQDCSWRRGILTKGLMNCHGISGVIYSMYRAFELTHNVTFLYRANKFQEFVISNDKLSSPSSMRVPQPPDLDYEFWVGSFTSASMLWIDIVYGKGMIPVMSGFDVRI